MSFGDSDLKYKFYLYSFLLSFIYHIKKQLYKMISYKISHLIVSGA